MAGLWAAAGHHVKFVSLTNGDIGHWHDAGGPLARRRNAEVQHAAGLLGITSEVLDNHDGEFQPTLENRRTVTRLIREWHADIVMGRGRTTTILTIATRAFWCRTRRTWWPCRSSARTRRTFMQNPVFLYYSDHFQKPYPFQADVVVGIDRAIEQKLNALVGMESQFVEGGVSGSPELIAGGEPKLERTRLSANRSATAIGASPKSPRASATPAPTSQTRRTPTPRSRLPPRPPNLPRPRQHRPPIRPHVPPTTVPSPSAPG